MSYRASLLICLAIVWVAVGVIGVVPAFFGEIDGAIALTMVLAFIGMIPTFMIGAALVDSEDLR